MPFHPGIGGKESLNLRAEGRRGDGLGEQTQARAVGLGHLQARLQGDEEIAPGRDFAEVADHLRAVGIVETEDGRLHLRVGAAERGRVVGIALDLRRPPHVALDEHARADAAEGERGGEVERLAGDEVLRLADVRDDLLRRAVARREPRQRDRSAHQLDEVAAVDAALERQRLLRELLLHAREEVVVARKLIERAIELLAFGALAEFVAR